MTVTLETVRAALACIPADLPRDEWARVAMAIKSEFSDATGRDLFDAWSASAPDHYDAKGVAATWRSVKPGGGVSIATLIHLAQQHGFKREDAPGQQKPTPEQLAQARREKEASASAEKRRVEEIQLKAAEEAERLWAAAADDGASPYLQRKGVRPHGVRFTPDQWLLVPLRDAENKLWSIQRIAPSKPDGGGPEKLLLKGGRKAGLWHMLGDPGAAPDLVLIAEGYATAATLHEATGLPVAVAFDAGNLSPVARALRSKYPLAFIAICGDDDKATEARTGRNGGREKATAAARAVGGVAVFPEGLAEGASDFNDLCNAQQDGRGLELVRKQVLAVVSKAREATKAPARRSRGRPPPHFDPAVEVAGFDPFSVNEDGVWYTPRSDDGPGAAPFRVCGPLRVTGLARDRHDNQAALVLEFDTQFRKGRKWLMPLSMLSGDGSSYRAALLSQGFMAPTDSKRRMLLTNYLQSRAPAELVRHVPRVGWYGRSYVLPDETLGASADGDHIMFHSEVGIEANFSRRGNLDAWQQNIARLCVGNTRMAFAVATALAGPLLAWASGTTGGGFHLVGPTSIGKTTGFIAAASVWGKGTENDPESYIQKWRATSNGLEYQGEQHNDCTLILDELGQMENGDAGASAYMLADGQGKTRGKGIGGLRPKPTWRLLFLSSGEITLQQQLEAYGKTMKGGQEVRLIPIPAEVSPGSALETFHEFEGGHALSGAVKHHAARSYGVCGRQWLEHLVSRTDGLAADLRQRMDRIEADLVPESAAGQVQRGGRRFALVAAAGEMATAAGLTGWPQGEAERAARACFNAWLASRGGAGSSEEREMLRVVRQFLAAHGDARFSHWHRYNDDRASKTMYRAGFKRLLDENGLPVSSRTRHTMGGTEYSLPITEEMTHEYFIFADVFQKEVCKEFPDYKSVCRILLQHGCLKPDGGRPFDCRPRLPVVGQTKCYRILPKIFDLDI